jgi:ribA/ribD-fused uncharacterized protein
VFYPVFGKTRPAHPERSFERAGVARSIIRRHDSPYRKFPLIASQTRQPLFLSRMDADNPLASASAHGFDLDGSFWASAEHYYQGMKFDDPELREAVRTAPNARQAGTVAQSHRRRIRRDWRKIRVTVMTRAIYSKCRQNSEAARALLATGDVELVESSQYDYYWGCGRDLRGENHFGKVLMRVRDKLREVED